MIRKTALIAGAAGALFLAAPAFAQETPAPQDAPAAAETPGLTLQPGAAVKSEDGSTLGQLAGVRTNAAGEQELTVLGADGQIRAVPLGGLRQDGADVVVGWSAEQFQAAPPVSDQPADPN